MSVSKQNAGAALHDHALVDVNRHLKAGGAHEVNAELAL